jgi:hypothetical protein
MRSLTIFKYVLFVLFILILNQKSFGSNNELTIHQLNKELVNILMKDQFSPPVASRIMAYANMGALYALEPKNKILKQLNNKIAETKLKGSDTLSVLVYSMVAKELVWSQSIWQSNSNQIIANNLGVINPTTLKNAELLTQNIVALTKNDLYAQRLTYPRFTVKNEIDSFWKLTPPTFKSPVEPYWGTLKTFFIPNTKMFLINPSFHFSKDSNSLFQKEVFEVYQISKTLTDEEKNTALYWDCNPLQAKVNGHIMQFNYRLTPSSHWIMITSQILEKEQIALRKSTEIYALLSLTMADAFIVCWSQKYQINRIRPVSVIQNNRDINWQPYIQTPDFPEFPSGHSLVSEAAATILTTYFGENYNFTDASQMRFGFSENHFDSFHKAAANAGISRLYGGIHYRDAINIGLKEGNQVAQYILHKLKK